MEDKDKKMQELQFIEQNLQNILAQKQAFQMEISEVDASLNELNSADDEVYKLVGNIMIKTTKEELKKGLEEKKKLFETRLKALDKQEETFNSRLVEIREELINPDKK